MKTPENVELVFNAKNVYWLASSCVKANYPGRCANFCVRNVSFFFHVGSSDVCNSDGNLYNPTYTVRPIVALNSNVTLTKDTTAENTWKIN